MNINYYLQYIEYEYEKKYMREIRTCCSMSRSVIVLTCIDIGFLLLNFVMCSGIVLVLVIVFVLASCIN